MSSIVLALGNGEALFSPDPVDTATELVTFVDPASQVVNAFDLSVLRGDGIFEATTVWKGFPVSLENHLQRLADSARLVDMPAPNIDAFTRAVEQVIAQYDDPEPGPMLRIIVSRGLDSSTGIGKTRSGVPTVLIFIDAKGTLHELDPITMISLTRGYSSDITGRAPWLLNGAKTLSYAFNCAVHRECDRQNAGDAVLYSEDGYTLECPNSSIVARYGDTFVTPDPRIGILHGTSQREMFAWAQQSGKQTEYRKLPIDELRAADSLYMAHGGWVIPVSELDGIPMDVNQEEIIAINEAIHSGSTREAAQSIAPEGEYVF